MRILNTLLLFTIALASCGQTGYQFKVKVDEHPNSKIVISEIYGEKFHPVDTIFTDEDGRASYTFTDDNSIGLYRMFLERNAFADFIFNKEDIEFETQFDHPMDSIKIISSTENKLYYDFLRADQQFQLKLELLNPLTTYYPKEDDLYASIAEKFDHVQAERDGMINGIMTDHPNSFVAAVVSFMRSPIIPSDLSEGEKMRYMQVHYFDKVNFNNPDVLHTDILPTRLITYLSLFSNRNFNQAQMENAFKDAIDLLMTRPFENQLVKEFVIEYLVGGFEKYGFESVILHIAENYEDETACENEERKSDLQTRLENYKKLAVGKTAPDISIPNEKGEIIKLSDIEADYTMIVFWATWCPHCTQWLPQIKDLYEKQKGKKVEVLSISLDKEGEEWRKYLAEQNFSWHNCSELKSWGSKAAIDYNIYATPTMIVVDKDRKIISKPLTMQQIQEEFKRK